LLSFLTFCFSIIAAVLAIDMYKLLRTGDFGKTWRLLIIACVMFALLQALKLAEVLNFHAMAQFHLSEIVELCFVMALAYAFYQQRRLFSRQSKVRREEEHESEDERDGHEDEYEYDDETEPVARRTQWPNVTSRDNGTDVVHR
jgi:hypothetical protein